MIHFFTTCVSIAKQTRKHLALCGLLLSSSLLGANTNVRITVENLAPADGTLLTPFWIGVHDGSYDLFDVPGLPNERLERMAEDGELSFLSAHFTASGSGATDGIIEGQGMTGTPPLFFPRQRNSWVISLDSTDPASQYLSYAAMVLPSNDAFVGNEDEMAHPLFDGDGNLIEQDIIIGGTSVYDAGTEVNDEIAANVPVLGQMTPDSGTIESGLVSLHPGFMEGGPVLTAFPNADFLEEGYRIARIRIEEVPEKPVTLRVTVENLAPDDGTLLTPFWLAFHDGGFDSYEVGEKASEGIERVAEDGDFNALGDAFASSGVGEVAGVLPGLGMDGTPPLFFPGQVNSWLVSVDANDPRNRYFSYAAMILPSNDAFVANDDAMMHEVFNDDGEFMGQDFKIAGSEVLDAGTEVNDEVAANVPVLGQMTPDTGPSENQDIGGHPGFMGGGPILTAYPDADFTSGGYEVARITIEHVQPKPIAVEVTVENLAPEEGTLLTPFWLGFHNGGFDLFEVGEAASEALERVAEDGVFDDLRHDFGASDTSGMDGILTGLGMEGTPPLFFPGQKNSWTVFLDGSNPQHQFLSYGAMILPSNDAFVGNDDAQGLPVFDSSGELIEQEWVIPGSAVYDAGTEINDEIPSHVPVLGQQAPDTGAMEGGVVGMHPGFMGGGEVLTAFPNADFLSAGYEVARISVRAAPVRNVRLEVTVENLAPEEGTLLTPFWLAFHDGSFDLFDIGEAASPALERVAEDGELGPLGMDFESSGAGMYSGILPGFGMEGTPPLFFPGQVNQWLVTLDANDPANRYFSYAAMILPSNDAFVANDDPMAYQVVNDYGQVTEQWITWPGYAALDAGTEVNDEIPENVPVLGQETADAGVAEGGVVAPHPGFEPGGNVLTSFPKADFLTPGYELVRIALRELYNPFSHLAVGEDGYRLDPDFGEINDHYFPYVLQEDHGWLYLVVIEGENAFWAYNYLDSLGWIYIDLETYPLVYHVDLGWLGYEIGSQNPRRFFDLSEGAFITIP